GLGLLLVALRAGIRTDGLGCIGRTCVVGGETDDDQQPAGTQKSDRPKTSRTEDENDFPPLLTPHPPASAVHPGPAWAGLSAPGEEQQAIPSRVARRPCRPHRRLWR